MVDQRTGMALSMALYTCRMHTNNFIQTCMSIELWKQGCSQKVVQTLNHMGISLGVKGGRTAVDKLRLGHADQMKEWKKQAEVSELNKVADYYYSYHSVQILNRLIVFIY